MRHDDIMTVRRALFIIGCFIAAIPLAISGLAQPQRSAVLNDPDATRAALQRALTEAEQAENRGERLEAEARAASEAVAKTATQAAALAARIQQAEAGLAAAEARIELIDRERAQLDQRLAQRREPLVRLTGALQKIARRPLALSALKPGSLRQTVYLRAMLESTVPQVRKRTNALRGEIQRGRALEREAAQAFAALRQNESDLEIRHTRLAALETRQRLASRRKNSAAARESERALALAEEARDLDGLLDELAEVGGLREELAALAGPIIRPGSSGGRANRASVASNPDDMSTTPAFQLPVTGRTLSGFGTATRSGVRSNGVTLVPREGAQVIAPAKGRVVFAGPYRGYDRIVIIEHTGGWTSLVTGLARADVTVGEELVGGSPLGVAGAGSPEITLELRRNGTAVNPLRYLR